jgi:dUTP pyrophosphatase
MQVKIKKLSQNATIPEYKTKGAAGFDIACSEDFTIESSSYLVVSTGIAMQIPEGYELEIRSRSGLAFKNHLYAYNGTIDSDYRGEIKILLKNGSQESYSFPAGTRIAQGIIKKVEQAHFTEVDKLVDTERNESGFGSTGL